MSKKSKKNSYYSMFESKKTKKKGKKTKAYEAPKLKSVKPSLDKDDAKKSKKILLAPVEIPKEFTKNRIKCNHAGDVISVAEFKAMTPTYAAYTPMLDSIVAMFGEENCFVCKRCFDILVGKDQISVSDVIGSINTLYAAANVVVANKRMKDDEIKDIAKVKNDLEDWMKIADLLGEITEKSSPVVDVDAPTTSTGAAGIDISALNNYTL